MTVVYEAVPMGEGKGKPVVVRQRGWWAGLAAWAGLLLLLLIYWFILTRYMGAAISEPDDNGYFAQGTLLAQTGRTWFLPGSDAQYIGAHWLLAPDGKFISRYPPGLAVAIALLDHLSGWRATLWLNPLLSLLALVGIFLAGRRIVGEGWGLCAAALLAFNPTFFHHALGGGSHMGVLCLLLWGIYLLATWADTGWWWVALLAGLVLGCIPTVRYADAIMGLGVIAFMLVTLRGKRPAFGKAWVHLVAAGVGAAIPIGCLLIRNQALFGAFWRTGYSLTNEQTGFSWAYFQDHAFDYIWQINSGGLGLLFGVGLAGIVAMTFAAGRRAMGMMLALMVTLMVLLYMAYYWAPQGNSQSTMRFLLPTFGLFVLGTVWVVKEVTSRAGFAGAMAVGAALVFVQLLWGGPQLKDLADRMAYQKQSLDRITTALEKTAQPGDVVIGMAGGVGGGGGGGLLQQLDFVRKWKIADVGLVNSRGGNGGGRFGGGAADAPSPRQAAKTAELREKYIGTPAEQERKFGQDLRAWAGPDHKVWVVGSENQVLSMDGLAGGHVTLAAHVPLPQAPTIDDQNAPFNAGPNLGGRGNGRGGRAGRAGGRAFAGGAAANPGDAPDWVIGQWQ